MSTVFLGTSEFAATVLERLAGSAYRPALVLTRPDRPSGRGRRLTAPPVAERARALGLPLEQPESVNDPGARELIARAGGPGVSPSASGEGERRTVVVCAYGALIKEPLLSEHEILNVHPSLLPRWRGAAPVERAIMAGDERTGVSIMRLTAGLDSGPVCLAGEEPIRAEDTYGSLSARLAELGGGLLVQALERSPRFVEQPEDGVTYAEKILPGDRLLDPRRPAVELERVVRALSPHVVARVSLPGGAMLSVHEARVIEAGPDAAPAPAPDRYPPQPPGEPLPAASQGEPSGPFVRDGRLLLACRPGELELLVVQPAGGRAMDASDYLHGHDPQPGRR
ncbi:MAG TPA: methionyl-tRNA formyltransferase [Solirubrobacteraceae bacterium]|nr:methionyl-tRNA formyltransferase [Solirubrobacteraceae bacterium]